MKTIRNLKLKTFEDFIHKIPNLKYQIHEIETKDKEKLIFFRLLKQNMTSNEENFKIHKNPIILQHGFYSSADEWILSQKSLGSFLALNNYDVWCTNSRGNKYNIHNLKNKEYSWSDMAQYDLPAVVDYVSEFSNNKKVVYLGQSQGSASMFAALSEIKDEKNNTIKRIHNDLEEFRKKISVFIALSPAVYVQFFPSITKKANISKLLPSNSLKISLTERMCQRSLKYYYKLIDYKRYDIINKYFNRFTDINSENVDYDILENLLSSGPSHMSSKNIKHWAQVLYSQEFKMFDYGKRKNIIKYNQSKPYYYDISTINIPIKIIYGTKDRLIKTKEIEMLLNDLNRNSKNKNEVSVKSYNKGHLSFILEKDHEYCHYILGLLDNMEHM